MIVLQQQNEFNRIWEGILTELANEKIYPVNEQQLDNEQQQFVKKYLRKK
jgi:polyphosphate kinase